jgi:hypothetical protein
MLEATESMKPSREADARVEEILERAAEFYESFLWESKSGRSARSRLAEVGIDESILREFQVGYAPVGRNELLEHLGKWHYSAAELQAAGIATQSERGHLHVHFRSRVMFPIRERPGRILGFAGLATHLGPSWPLWLSSPESGHYQRDSAIFGIRQASPAIARAGRAIVLDDCLEVLRLHQQGQQEAVAVIQSPITQEHLEQLAAELPVDVSEVGLARQRGREKGSGDVLIVGPYSDLGSEAFALDEGDDAVSLEHTSRASSSGIPQDGGGLTRRARILQGFGVALIGVGIPLGWLRMVSPNEDDPGGVGSGFAATIGGVAASYLLLAIVVAFVSARSRARSSTRRMRAPWEHGATEWQPEAWTYHRLEEVLIAAAVVSVAACTILFLTIGGFTG